MTITPGSACPVCGKAHRAGSKPLAACQAKLAEVPEATVAEATPEDPRPTVPTTTATAPEAAPRPANGLRLLLPARKSRKGEGESADYTRQTNTRVIERAEREGNVVVKVVEDTISSQSMPWERKNLKGWMTRPELLAQWDALYVTETDRLARLDDEGFHRIETWLYDHGKSLITAEDVCFPPRHDGDRYLWVAMKRRARTYWEDVRDEHASIREVIRANGAAIGKPPFGYRITGAKLHKTFEIDPVTGPLAKEAFQRIADGRTATSVAEYLTEATGNLWRVKRVTDTIKRTSYLGERDGHTFTPLVTRTLWDSANAALSARSISTGGRRAVHGYSGVILCPCGAPLYHHQSTRNGKPVGAARYRCSRGRRGIAGELKCSNPALPFTDTNAAVDAEMRADESWPWVTETTGGDAARQAQLASIKAEMNTAIAQGDMGRVGILAAKYAELDSQPAQPIITKTTRVLDKTIGELWQAASLADQREMLSRYQVTVHPDLTVWVHDLGDIEETVNDLRMAA